jgi:hypothetical protein
MKNAKSLAIAILLILAVSMANAALPVAKSPSQISTLNPQLLAPHLNINLIKIAPAAAGNNKPVNVSVNVTPSATQQDICGLNATNFKIDTLGMPNAPFIKNVYPISSYAINQPMHCDYWLSIVPALQWTTGIYMLKLDYVQGGQQIVSRTFSFRI